MHWWLREGLQKGLLPPNWCLESCLSRAAGMRDGMRLSCTLLLAQAGWLLLTDSPWHALAGGLVTLESAMPTDLSPLFLWE